MVEFERVFSFPVDILSIIGLPEVSGMSRHISPAAKDLYYLYENDFLFLSERTNEFQSPESLGYDSKASETVDRSTLCNQVFAEFDKIVATQIWQLNEDEIIEFFWHRVDQESALIRPCKYSDEYSGIAKRKNAIDVCKFYLTQFSLDYLTEASPLTRALPGSFGEYQMAIFKIVSDEYGNGSLENKHSVLFQGMLSSVGMPTDLHSYRGKILDSVYMYMSYVNRLADDKNLFFRFLGFLYVYESCLIYPTQQQGYMMKDVFGPETDTRYFDYHVEIDQDHSVWVVEKLLVPAVKRFGSKAAREILKGYHETNLLLSLCDWEMTETIENNTDLGKWTA